MSSITTLLGCLLLGLLAGCGKDAPRDTPGRGGGEKPAESLRMDEEPDAHVPFLRTATLDRAEEEIDAANGGSVELADGFRVTLPPGSLRSSSRVILEKAVAPAAENPLLAEDFDYYRVSAPANGSKLAGPPMRVRLPLGDVTCREGAPPLVLHLSSDGERRFLEGTVTPDGTAVEVEAKSFSLMELLGYESRYIDLARKVVLGQKPAKRLPAAYYSQQPYQWCWACCASMMFSSFAKEVPQPQEVAVAFQATKEMGINMRDEDLMDIVNRYPSMLSGLSIKSFWIGRHTPDMLVGRVISLIDRNTPVWVGMPAIGHAVLVVGYDNVGFFVHDPEGTLVGAIHGDKAAEAAAGQLAGYRVRYDHWKKTLGGVRSIQTSMAWIEGFENRPPAGRSYRTVSIQIKPGNFGDVEIGRRKPGERLPSEYLYPWWNGLAEGGAGFSTQKDADEELGMDGLCNSDSARLVAVRLHNSGARKFTGEVQLLLEEPGGSERVMGSKPVNGDHAVPAGATNHLLFLARRKSSDTTEVQILESLNFRQHPMHPGSYVLIARLVGPGGNPVVDTTRIPFEHHPGILKEPRVWKRIINNKVMHEVLWMPAVESQKLKRHVTYVIYRRPAGGSGKPREVDRVQAPTTRRLLEATAGSPDTKWVYRVRAVDDKTGLKSPEGNWSDPVDSRLSQGPTADLIVGKWVKAVKKSGGGWRPLGPPGYQEGFGVEMEIRKIKTSEADPGWRPRRGKAACYAGSVVKLGPKEQERNRYPKGRVIRGYVLSRRRGRPNEIYFSGYAWNDHEKKYLWIKSVTLLQKGGQKVLISGYNRDMIWLKVE